MGAKQSSQMRYAKDLIINGGYSVIEAARLADISYQAIYISIWYKDWKKSKYQLKGNNEEFIK